MKTANSLYEMFYNSAIEHPKRVAIIDGKTKLTYQDVLNYSDRIAGFLQSINAKKGERIAVFMLNRWEYLIAVLAILRIGGVVVPINTQVKSKRLSFVLADADIEYMICSDELRETVVNSIAIHKCPNIIWVGDNVVGTRFMAILKENFELNSTATQSDDTAIIFYTSGTEGEPKGAMLSNKNILYTTQETLKHINFSIKDRTIVFMPLHHSYSLIVSALMPLIAGGSIVFSRYTTAEMLLKSCLNSGVTILLATPRIHSEISKIKTNWFFNNFNRLRLIISGGSSLDTEIAKKIQEKFKKADFIEGYGLSETSAVVTINPPKRYKLGSSGISIGTHKIKIVDSYGIELPARSIGEIIVSGDNVMQGYTNTVSESNCAIRKGWLYTGDMGYIDSDGYLYIVDRKKDLIISNIAHIYPKEIEDLINNFNGVLESAVVAKKSEDGYEIPVAFLVNDDSGILINIENLKKYLSGFLATYKVPKEFIIIDSSDLQPPLLIMMAICCCCSC